MGEVYGLVALMLASAGVGWLVIMKAIPKKVWKPTEGGTWRRVQETVASREGTFVRILLVREKEDRETGRLVIREIDSRDQRFEEMYDKAIIEANKQLVALNAAEQS